MALVVFSRRWTSKPPIGTQLGGDVLVRGLRFALLLNEFSGPPRSLTKPIVGTFTGTPKWDPEGMRFDGASNVAFQDEPSLQPPGPFTFAIWVRPTVLGANNECAGKGNASNPANTAYRITTQDALNRVSWRASDGTTSTLLAAADLLITDTVRWHLLAGSWDGATMRIFLDGRKSATTSAFAGPLNTSTSNLFSIGRLGTGASPIFYTGQIREFYLWDRALRQEEIQRLWVEPYAMLRAQRLWAGDAAL